LVMEALNIQLPKSHSRADWARRPLPDAQLRYAADDVVYLARLYQLMHDQLLEHNRLNWLDDDFSELETPSLYEKPPEQMWLKVRGIQKYKGHTLTAIQKLAAWRETIAKESDLPRNWLMKDDILLDIARQAPDSVQELSHIRGLGDKTLRKHGDTLVQLLKQAATETPVPLPPFAKKAKLGPAQDAIIDLLTTLTKIRSEELSINAAVLAPRKELEKLLSDPEHSSLIHGWRKKLIGQQLQALLNGEISMRIENARIRLENPVSGQNSG
ncbi:MAG: HRDC domain-containing protein, partial [Gammaproteobacteria bacterium]|nr:HRDC domain-containing protein [Gammaproteobacteria bacterium]